MSKKDATKEAAMDAAKAASEGRDLAPAVRSEGALSTNVMDMADLQKDAGQGFNTVTQDDVAIPFLVILQSMSPQVKKGPAKVEGSEEGDIYNTVTKQLFKGNRGLTIVPCAFQKRWVEWKLREQGGGFVKAYDTDEILKQCTRNDRNQDMLPNGHQVVTTAYHYVLVVNEDGTFERVVIGMSSTQLKKSRQWLSRMMGLQVPTSSGGSFTPPMYGQTYFITTGIETKDQNSWYGWVIDRPQLVAKRDLYDAAKRFFDDVSKKKVDAGTPPADEGATAPAGAPEDTGHF